MTTPISPDRPDTSESPTPTPSSTSTGDVAPTETVETRSWARIVTVIVIVASVAGAIVAMSYFSRSEETVEEPELLAQESEWTYVSGSPSGDLYIPEGTYRIRGSDDNVIFSLSVWEKDFEEVDPDRPDVVIDPNPKSRLKNFELKGSGENLGATAASLRFSFRNIDLEGESLTHRFRLKVRLREFRETADSIRGFTERLQSRVQQRYGQEWFPQAEERITVLENDVSGLKREVADVRDEMSAGFEKVNASLVKIADDVSKLSASSPPE